MVERLIPSISSLLPKRLPNTHKGKVGRVAVIAGSKQMLGAAILTALAALKTGSGLVYLLTVPEAIPLVNTQYPELIVCDLESKDGFLTQKSIKKIESYHQKFKFDAIAIGPGMGRTEGVQKLIQHIIYEWVPDKKIPTVVDADGLMALNSKDLSKVTYSNYVVTPHPKEFESLFSIHVKETDEDRIQAAVQATKDCHKTVLLKGHHSIASYQDQYYINLNGNPGMATAGAGDVLTGVIAGFIGQGVSLFEATMCGAYIHGKAGDLAFKTKNIGLTSKDILESLPKSLKSVRSVQSR